MWVGLELCFGVAMVAGGGTSGGQNRALVKELERIWDVPQGNKDLCFSE